MKSRKKSVEKENAVIAPKKSVDEEIEKKVEEERMEEEKCQKRLTEQLVERQQLELEKMK